MTPSAIRCLCHSGRSFYYFSIQCSECGETWLQSFLASNTSALFKMVMMLSGNVPYPVATADKSFKLCPLALLSVFGQIVWIKMLHPNSETSFFPSSLSWFLGQYGFHNNPGPSPHRLRIVQYRRYQRNSDTAGVLTSVFLWCASKPKIGCVGRASRSTWQSHKQSFLATTFPFSSFASMVLPWNHTAVRWASSAITMMFFLSESFSVNICLHQDEFLDGSENNTSRSDFQEFFQMTPIISLLPVLDGRAALMHAKVSIADRPNRSCR